MTRWATAVVWTAGTLIGVSLAGVSALGDEPAGDANAKVEERLAETKEWPGIIRSSIGVTRHGTRIPCLITRDDLDYNDRKMRILLIGGLEGSPVTVDRTLMLMKWFATDDAAKPYREKFAVSAVPIANPDGWASGKGPGNLSGGDPTKGYPPQGSSYNSRTDPEAQYLWRWIGMHAPHTVLRFVPAEDSGDESFPTQPHGSLTAELPKGVPAGTGRVSGLTFRVTRKGDADILEFLQKLHEVGKRLDSEPPAGGKQRGPTAAQVIADRRKRSAAQMAAQLSRHYGHDLRSVAYIPAVALIGRLQLGDNTGDDSHLESVERTVAPYFDGEKPTLGKNVSGSHLSGHLIFGELAKRTEGERRKRYTELVLAAADLGFDENGQPKKSMPAHSEMSDAVFMGCPILVQAGRLTGDRKYYEMALRHLRFMLELNLREDGLHRHSPLDETAWGRGNGFPALGLALCLTDLPEDDPVRPEMLKAIRAHLAALVPHQDPTGMWHQVVDHPESYRELSSTCMITFAMLRGMRNGWLDEKTFRPVADKAWAAITTRVAPDGQLVDVCTGTGKQRSLRDYYDRTAILGRDPRGGAMALLVATERQRLENSGE